MRVVTTADGKMMIHEEAVACVAGLAALDCPGVAGMAAHGLQDGLADIFGRDNPHRGVEVELDEGGCSITLEVIVTFGARIADVADELIRRVREAVERSTGCSVARVEVNVQGVRRAGDEGD